MKRPVAAKRMFQFQRSTRNNFFKTINKPHSVVVLKSTKAKISMVWLNHIHPRASQEMWSRTYCRTNCVEDELKSWISCRWTQHQAFKDSARILFSDNLVHKHVDQHRWLVGYPGDACIDAMQIEVYSNNMLCDLDKHKMVASARL